MILKAGALLPGEDDGTNVFKDVRTLGDKYEDYPDDEDKIDVNNIDVLVEAAKDIREGGNALFKAGKFQEALTQYRSEYQSSLAFRDSPKCRSVLQLVLINHFFAYRMSALPRHPHHPPRRLDRRPANSFQLPTNAPPTQHRAGFSQSVTPNLRPRPRSGEDHHSRPHDDPLAQRDR